MSCELNMPTSTVYKKLKLLEDAEVIQNVKTLTTALTTKQANYHD